MKPNTTTTKAAPAKQGALDAHRRNLSAAQSRVSKWLRGIHQKGWALQWAKAYKAAEEYCPMSPKVLAESLAFVHMDNIQFHLNEAGHRFTVSARLRRPGGQGSYNLTFPARYVGRPGSKGGLDQWTKELTKRAHESALDHAKHCYKTFLKMQDRYNPVLGIAEIDKDAMAIVDLERNTVPCAYCHKMTPPARQAAPPWRWPKRGIVTNCLDCAGEGGKR